jgi:hypothetical protein
LRSLTSAARRRRPEDETLMEIPVRILKTRTSEHPPESPTETLMLGFNH